VSLHSIRSRLTITLPSFIIDNFSYDIIDAPFTILLCILGYWTLSI
jgi:hypothetical protein